MSSLYSTYLYTVYFDFIQPFKYFMFIQASPVNQIIPDCIPSEEKAHSDCIFNMQDTHNNLFGLNKP